MSKFSDIAVDFVTKFWLDYNNDDVKEITKYITDDFQYESPFTDKTSMEWYNNLNQSLKISFTEISLTIKDVFENETKVCLVINFKAKNTGVLLGLPASNRWVDFDFVDILEFNEGKISSLKSLYDVNDLKHQVKLPL